MAIPVRIVLYEPTHPGNIGAAARALKTMGLSQLVLVRPVARIDDVAIARSSGAADVLESANIVDKLEDGIGDCGLVAATSARHRRLGCAEWSPRECARALHRQSLDRPAALIFGPEASGLPNGVLDRCNALVSIPANPAYSSLNLAMAVQLLSYEIRLAWLDDQPDSVTSGGRDKGVAPASLADMEHLYGHFERALLDSGFLNPDNPRHLMRRIRRLFNRAGLDQNELNIMRGVLSALAPGSGDNRGGAPAHDEVSDGD
jgi:tRNA/rRNA methyltransferase/tRNA (cytidine32/uridine32-2'-O)-methyltransferase